MIYKQFIHLNDADMQRLYFALKRIVPNSFSLVPSFFYHYLILFDLFFIRFYCLLSNMEQMWFDYQFNPFIYY